jgi:integrase
MSASKPRRSLVEAAYAPSTLKRYKDAVLRFLSWCSDQDEDPSSPEQFDDLLTDYFHHLYESGLGKQLAHNTLYGILMHLPHLKHHLHLSSKSLIGWNKLHPPKSYPPLTWELSCLIAFRLAVDGHFRSAVGVVVAFDCFLRVGELVGLRMEDVADAKDARIGVDSVDMTLRLRSTKTGPNQWVVVENPVVKTLVRQLVSSSPPNSFLFPFTASAFRNHFKSACADLNLSPLYVPHSLRHGGATRLHLLGRPMEDILLRGRWASTKSARRYIQSGKAMLMTMDVPRRAQDLARAASSELLLLLTLAQSHSVKVR